MARAITKTTSEAEPGAEDCKDCIMDRELSLSDCILDILDNSTDFTDSAVESTGCTNCAKLTDVRKRHVSSSKGQQLCTNPLVEALRMQEHRPGPPNTS